MLQVRTIWPTFIEDSGKDRIFAAIYTGEHVPDYGSARRALPGRTFASRAAAKAYCDRLNGVDLDDWKAR